MSGSQSIGEIGLRNLLSTLLNNQNPRPRKPQQQQHEMSNNNNMEIDFISSFNQNMKSFRFGQCGLKNECSFLIANCFPRLESLDLSFCSQLNDSAMENISFSCPLLRHLDISYVGRELSLDSIQKSINRMKNLVSLSLRGLLQFSEQSLTHPNIQSLNLSWCKNLKDSALISIVNGFPLLENLQLAWCSCISSISIQHLNQSINLRLLNLRGCTQIPNALIKYLQTNGKILNNSMATPSCSPPSKWLLTWL
jgi:hypothetical protein